MGEHAWHRKVRKEEFSRYNSNFAYQSHSDVSKLYLFNIAEDRKPRRIDCLSDADIVVLDPDTGKIAKVIEIESALNPKKILGIVLATHLCNKCSIREKQGEEKRYLDLDNIVLEIIYKKAPPRSKKDLKLAIFKPFIETIVHNAEGCISKVNGVIIRAHD